MVSIEEPSCTAHNLSMHLSHDSVSQSSRAGPPYPINKMVGAVLADPDVSRRKSTPENLIFSNGGVKIQPYNVKLERMLSP